MGVTGSTANGVVSTSLPAQIKRIRKFTSAPLAVGFGVATAAHFDTVAQSGASGVVIGSRIVGVIGDAKGSEEERASAVETYCREVSSGAGKNPRVAAEEPSEEVLDKLVKEAEPELAAIPVVASDGHGDTLPSRFGDFGGQYVAEALVDSLVELEMAHKSALADPSFWKEFEGLYGYINRPSQLYEATRLTEHAGGAKIWLKSVHYSPLLFISCADADVYFLDCAPLLGERISTTLDRTRSTTRSDRSFSPVGWVRRASSPRPEPDSTESPPRLLAPSLA